MSETLKLFHILWERADQPDRKAIAKFVQGRVARARLQHYKPQAEKILDFLNERTGRNFQPVDANLKLIMARLCEGYTEDQCRQVIVKMARKWRNDPNMADYLRPKTLFNATNFANYEGMR